MWKRRNEVIPPRNTPLVLLIVRPKTVKVFLATLTTDDKWKRMFDGTYITEFYDPYVVYWSLLPDHLTYPCQNCGVSNVAFDRFKDKPEYILEDKKDE